METIKLMVNIILIISTFSVIYIAIHCLILDEKNKGIIKQYEEETDELKIQIGHIMGILKTSAMAMVELNTRVKQLEKGNKNAKKRDSSRQNKTSN